MALPDHAKGYLITLAGVAIITPDTLLIRLAALEPFTLAVSRGVLGGAVVLVLSALWYRGGLVAQFRGLGLWVAGLALLMGIGTLLFVLALEHTTAANVLIVFSTTPMIAAVMGRVFLGEPVSAATWRAILACFGGLLIVASGSLGTVHLWGDFLALLDATSLAAVYVMIRRLRAVNMIPATGLGLVMGALLALPLATFPPVAPLQWLWIGLAGLVVVPFSLMLLTLGPRYLAAPEVAMLMLLETVVGPFWVWLALAEEPSARSLLGGAIIVTALFLHALLRFRRAAPVTGLRSPSAPPPG